MTPQGDQFVTVRELADRWGVSTQTIRRMIERGEIRAVPVGGGDHRIHHRISAEWIRDYETEQLESSQR